MVKWIVNEALDSSISIVDGAGDKEICFDIPLKVDQGLDVTEFSYFLLEKRDVLENDIRVARVKELESEKIVGWLIPITALESTEHSRADDPHFLKAASLALNLIMTNLAEESAEILGDKPYLRLNLSSHFGQDCVVFIYQPSAMGVLDTLNKLPPIFLANGYFLKDENRIGDVKYQVLAQESIGRDLYLNLPSSEITSYSLIAKIINNSFSIQESGLLKFFLLYQSIELLIDLVLESEYRIAATELADQNLAIKEIQSRLKRMTEASAQRKRINLLLGEYCKVDEGLSEDLRDSCESFLVEMGEECLANANAADLLYDVRNMIFHGYASLEESAVESKLETLVDSLLAVLGCLAISYGSSNRVQTFNL